jgi:hypothetical protein
MAFWNNFFDWLGLGSHGYDDFSGEDSVGVGCEPPDSPVFLVNPATGLPMLNGGVDAGGSPFGMDIHHHEEPFSSSSSYSTDDWPPSSDWNDPFST